MSTICQLCLLVHISSFSCKKIFSQCSVIFLESRQKIQCVLPFTVSSISPSYKILLNSILPADSACWHLLQKYRVGAIEKRHLGSLKFYFRWLLGLRSQQTIQSRLWLGEASWKILTKFAGATQRRKALKNSKLCQSHESQLKKYKRWTIEEWKYLLSTTSLVILCSQPPSSNSTWPRSM